MPSEGTIAALETQAALNSIAPAAWALADAQGPATARESPGAIRAASCDISRKRPQTPDAVMIAACSHTPSS
jgi:hypothetical protein